MPVTRAVEMPNHEFVREKLMPRMENTEKFLRNSWELPTSIVSASYHNDLKESQLTGDRLGALDIMAEDVLDLDAVHFFLASRHGSCVYAGCCKDGHI